VEVFFFGFYGFENAGVWRENEGCTETRVKEGSVDKEGAPLCGGEGKQKQKQSVFLAMDFAVVFVVTLLAVACFLASVDAERAAAEKEERSSILGYAPEDLSSESRMLRLFEKWQQQHGKKDYGGMVTEKERRFLIFKENLQYVDAHGKKNSTYWLGLNKFADLSNQEFRAKYTGTKIDRNRRLKKNHQKKQRKSSGFRYADVEAPDSIDWREKGAVAAVKDQGSCGNHLPQFSLIDLLLRHSLSPLSSAFFAGLFAEQAIPIHRSVLQYFLVSAASTCLSLCL
jgi:hypothetical protein